MRLGMGGRNHAWSVGDLIKPDIGGAADAQDVISLRHERKRETGLACDNLRVSCRRLVVGELQRERSLVQYVTVALKCDDPLHFAQLRKRHNDIFPRAFFSQLEREWLGGAGPQGVARVDREGIAYESLEGTPILRKVVSITG